jgi:hypothetical protein
VPGGAEEKHEKPKSREPVFGKRVKSRTAPMLSISTAHSATTSAEILKIKS